MKVRYIQRSSYNLRERLGQRVWRILNATVFRWSPNWFCAFRRSLLRVFGADISPRAVIHPSATISYPWRLTILGCGSLGEGCVVECHERVHIADYAIIGQGAILQTGSHDIRDPRFSLVAKPISVEYGAWVGMHAIVLPGVTISEGAVLGAGAVVRRSTKKREILIGNLASAIGFREFYTAGEV